MTIITTVIATLATFNQAKPTQQQRTGHGKTQCIVVHRNDSLSQNPKHLNPMPRPRPENHPNLKSV